jgi:hypothetical protein
MATDGGGSFITQPDNANSTEASPFLRLPGELRNRIYEYVAEGVKARVTKKNSIVLPAALACVNRRIRKEYLEVLMTTKRPLHAIVTDFDFKPLIVALISLHASPCKAMLVRDSNGTSRMTLEIGLHFGRMRDDPDPLSWCQIVTSQGPVLLDISYHVTESSDYRQPGLLSRVWR